MQLMYFNRENARSNKRESMKGRAQGNECALTIDGSRQIREGVNFKDRIVLTK